MAVEGELKPESFQCAQCGVCCRTQKAVLLTLPDLYRIAERLGMTPGAFYKKYCMRSDRLNDQALTRIYLKTEGGCPFLQGNICAIHDFKPVVCARNPFYYVESSLAVLKVIGVITPGCSIDALPYGTIVRGDADRIVDMEIEVAISDVYMGQYGKFDERKAREYYELACREQSNPDTRAATYLRVLDDCLRREELYRNDPYYRGSTYMYLSGFYNEFLKDVTAMKALEPALFSFEPTALGVIDGVMTLVLQEDDFAEARSRLAGKEGEMLVKPLLWSDIEYGVVSLRTGDSPPVAFYFYVSPDQKRSLKGLDGRITVELRNGKGRSCSFVARDRDGWQQQ